MIEFLDVKASRGSRLVLNGITLAVAKGEIIALAGQSGSGKTTLLRLVNHMLRPDSGEVRVAGKNVVRRYDLQSGLLKWEKEIEDSYGRGCVTDTAVYVPVRDSILQLDLEKGREISQVGVALTSDEPLCAG